MKLTIIGTGYVGLVTGTCFSEMGNTVYCLDINEKIIDDLKNGIIPIYEPQLEEMVKNNQKRKNLFFTTDNKDAIKKSNIYFIAVGTPMNENGSANLDYVLKSAKNIGKYMENDSYIIIKSTVPVGTSNKVKEIILKELEKRNLKLKVNMISNPEFLKEGSAVNDCMRPDRIVIGADNEDSFKIMKSLYDPFIKNHDRYILMDIKSAEMTKYAANSMLATRISFMNEMANICKLTGADINNVRKGIGSDKRIGYSFLYAGCGYGGSCFPKDIQALIKLSKDNGYESKILKAVESVNQDQKLYLVNQIIDYFGENLNDLTFGLWGLAFKPDTDDMRQASSITVINELTSRGAKIKAYDPKAIEEAKNNYLKDNNKIEYVENKYTSLEDVDAMILITEWKEFRNPDFNKMKNIMKNSIIFDGRNQYNKDRLNEYGFKYYQIGV